MPTRPNITMICLPANTPDRRTSLNDLRAALCLYTGVHIDDIHPASGHDLSLDSYLRVRAQWVEQHEKNPDEWTWRNSAQVHAMWERNRPKYLADHPWPEPPPTERGTSWPSTTTPPPKSTSSPSTTT